MLQKAQSVKEENMCCNWYFCRWPAKNAQIPPKKRQTKRNSAQMVIFSYLENQGSDFFSHESAWLWHTLPLTPTVRCLEQGNTSPVRGEHRKNHRLPGCILGWGRVWKVTSLLNKCFITSEGSGILFSIYIFKKGRLKFVHVSIHWFAYVLLLHV